VLDEIAKMIDTSKSSSKLVPFVIPDTDDNTDDPFAKLLRSAALKNAVQPKPAFRLPPVHAVLLVMSNLRRPLGQLG